MKLTALNKKLLMTCGVYEEVADIIMERITTLEKDKARLDWLDKQASFYDGGDSGYGSWSWEVGCNPKPFIRYQLTQPEYDVRAAIDAARAGKGAT